MTDLLKKAQRLHTAGQYTDALFLYLQIVDDDPHDAEALYLLGTLLAQRGSFEKAELFLRRAIEHDPHNSVYHCNLGVTLQNLSQLDQAKGCFQSALRLDRENVDAYYNLAKLSRQLEQIDAALLNYEQALSLDPSRSDVLINMANILVEQGRPKEAVHCFRQAEKINPHSGRVYVNLGNTYRRMGLAKEAVQSYSDALCVQVHDGLRIKRALTLPVVYRDHEHISECRTELETHIEALLDDDLVVTDPSLETSTTNFFLAYQNQNNRDLHKSIADLHLKSCPALSWTAPHCNRGARKEGKVRIGFVSSYFRQHSVGRMMVGLITQLPREEFEIVLITSRGKIDPISRAIEAAVDSVYFFPENYFEGQMEIGNMGLDLLFFAEIGMDVRTYFLAFARLAPVQCVTWGHPDTTGIPNLDYFLSSTLIEPEEAAGHYSEQLYCLQSPPACYPRPELPEVLKSRSDLGMHESATLYLCLQSTVKFHPDLDEIFAGILRGHDNAEIYVVEGAVSCWTEQVRKRWRTTIPDVEARIHVVPRQKPQDFVALIATADVVLDTPHFSGGNTSYEAFMMSRPVVTLESTFMRGRVTAGLYRLMDVNALTAMSLEDYVAIALRLGKDQEFNHFWRARIKERRDVLFDRKDVVDEFVDFTRNII